MTNYKINPLQFCSMMILLMISSFFGTGVFSIIKASGIDSYLSVIMAGIFSIPVIWFFLIIFSYEPALPLHQKITKLFGKVFGTIINIVVVSIIFLQVINLVYNLSYFIVSQILPETSFIFVALFFSIPVIFANYKGIETITRIALIILAINVFLWVIAQTGLFPKLLYTNFMPFLEHGIKRPIFGSLYVIAQNISPIFILLMIPKNSIVNKEKINKHILISYFIGIIIMFMAIFQTLGVLGIELSTIYEYPLYSALRNINLFDFLDRVENFLALQWLFPIFWCISFLVYASVSCVNYGNKNKLFTITITYMAIWLSNVLFRSGADFNNYIYTVSFTVNLAFVGLFVIIGILCLFKRKKA